MQRAMAIALLCLLALIALVVWTIVQFVPASPAWLGKACLIVLLWCLTLMACDFNIDVKN
jgi:uncharacterized membrane protein